MDHQAEARRLLSTQRRILLRHLKAGELVSVPIIRLNNPDNRARDMATKPLVDRGMLRFHQDGSLRPYATTMTENGRMVAAYLIAEYADALSEAAGVDIGPVPDTKWREALARVAAAQASYTKPAKSPKRKTSTNPSSSDSDIGR